MDYGKSDKYMITITLVNGVGKRREKIVVEKDKIGVARTIINFVPSRGYEIVAYFITTHKELI